jgi:hypothetical protein
MVVSLAMTNTYNEFLMDEKYISIFKKFLLQKIDMKRFRYLIPSKAEAA